jgi:hypothetical protein
MAEYSPLGYVAAITGRDGFLLNDNLAKRYGIETEFGPRRKRDLMIKATVGTLGMAAVALLSNLEYEDEDGKKRPILIVTADGTGNYENAKIAGLSGDEQFQEYTVDFMGERFSYKYSPFAAWFLPTGFAMDKERYGKYGNENDVEQMNKFYRATYGYMTFMKDQSSIKGVSDLFNLGSNKDPQYGPEKNFEEKMIEAAKKSGAGFIRNLLLPNAIPQVYRQYKGFIDAQESSGITFTDRLVKDIPFLDQFVNKKYDHFGQPIDSKWKIPGIYDERPSGNPLYDLCREKRYIDQLKYFRGSSVTDYDGNKYDLTEETSREVSLRMAQNAGVEFNERYGELSELDNEQFSKEANDIFKRALQQAVSDVFGVEMNIRSRLNSQNPEK